MCGAHMFGQWSGDLECGVREVTRVILMYVDTADCYKVPQSGASIGEQAR